MLLAKTLNKNCKINIILAYLLLIVNIKNDFIIFKQILKLVILKFWFLTIRFILFSIIFLIHFIAIA